MTKSCNLNANVMSVNLMFAHREDIVKLQVNQDKNKIYFKLVNIYELVAINAFAHAAVQLTKFLCSMLKLMQREL